MTASRLYTDLDPHTSVFFYVVFELHGTWNAGQEIKMEYNSETVSLINSFPTLHNQFLADECEGTGAIAKGVNDIISWGHIIHTTDTLLLKFTYINPSNEQGSFGFRDVRLMFTTTSPPATSNIWWHSADIVASDPTRKGVLCPPKQYYGSGASCEDCDITKCKSCFGPLDSHCMSCEDDFYYSGSACVSCHSSCDTCSGTDEDQCISCSGSYYFMNGHCITCDDPLIRTTISGLNYCSSPCDPNDFIYPDGSCFSFCDPRFVNVTNNTGKFCTSPCPAGDIVYNISSCIDPANCLYPMDLILYGSLNICEYTCTTGTVKYMPTNLCILPSDCQNPYAIKSSNGFDSCEPACPNSPPGYTYWNGSCNSFCPSKMTAVVENGFLMCNLPKCGVETCSHCTSNGIEDILCPADYSCDVYLGRVCLPVFRYYLEAVIGKPFLNGFLIQVEVYPTKNGLVPGINDTIVFSIDGLTSGVDYNIDITSESVGLFQIRFEFLKDPDNANLNARFVYSPNSLNLNTMLKLPKIVFIGQSMQTATAVSQGSSKLLFILFLVAVVGMIFGGGISALWASLPESQYSYYLVYLNIGYLHHTTKYLQSMSNYDFLSGSGSGSKDDDETEMLDPIFKKSLPHKFYMLGYPADFIANVDQVLIQVAAMIVCLFVTRIILRYIRFPRQLFFIQKRLHSLLQTLKWNGLFRQALTYILPLSMASFIQIHHSLFGKAPGLFPLLLAIATLIILVWTLIKMYLCIKRTPRKRYKRAIYSRLYGTLWEGLNINQAVSRYYYWLTALRGFILSYVCVFCDLFPYVQIIVILVYQIGIVALFINGFKSIRPVFSESGLNKVMLVEEGLVLVMKMVIFAFLHLIESASNNTLIILGWLIVLPVGAVQIIQVLFSIFEQIKNRRKWIRLVKLAIFKLKNKKRVKRIRRRTRIYCSFADRLNTENGFMQKSNIISSSDSYSNVHIHNFATGKFLFS